MSKFKVKCTGFKRHERYFTKGKVYVWEDGNITNDNGFTYSRLSGMAKGEDVNEWTLGGWYTFEKVNAELDKILITTDGNVTLARMFEGNKVIKSAEAKCSPHDTFDFSIGANLAYDRLMGRGEKMSPTPKDQTGIDWNAFLRGEVLVECTESNRSAFIEELACKFPALFWGTGTYPLKDYEPWENNFHIVDGGLYHNNGLQGFRGSKNIKQRVTYQPAEKPQDNSAERRALADKICEMGMCSVNSSNRKKDCPFYSLDRLDRYDCVDYAAAHPETQKIMEDYLAAEQDKPAEPAPEPIKLYCVKDGAPFFTKGKMYEISKREILCDGGWVANGVGGYESLADFEARNISLRGCLFPLVQRPAKVGEYILPDEGGTPVKVERKCRSYDDCLVLEDGRHTREFAPIKPIKYLVLDGYQPEPECCRCCGQPLKKESAR